jgi:glyoxylase-like metal-dependent hydrolase (beta-lactamase superfamily II)
MPLTHRFTVGSLVCHTIEAGLQRLDGGAMFGVVPKPLWERRIPADARNRIPLQMRCLLIEHPDGLVLIDTGSGNKDDAKFKDIYGIENAGDPGPTALEDGIREAGHDPADVKWVINTHLHFDHAGGDTTQRLDGSIIPSFPGATYVVQKGEMEFAASPNERIRASYLARNYQPVALAGRFLLILDDVQILPGIRSLRTPGHVPFHQSILVQDGGETACFLGDLVPTTAHLPAPWIMGYDLEPLVTLETKKRVLKRAADEGWLLIFEHDPVVGGGRLARDEKRGWAPELAERCLTTSG